MKKNKDLIYFLVIAILLVGGFWIFKNNFLGKTNAPVSTKLQVTTSFYPLYFFTSQIGGDRADVTNIIPTGAEPHDYEPSAHDIIAIEKSKLLILNGDGLESWGEKISQMVTLGRPVIIVAGNGISSQSVTEGGVNTIDPHIWLSPILAQTIVQKILQGFISVDPENSVYYEMNAQALLMKLSDLDVAYKEGLAVCESRNIVTSHSAFGYLASAYNLNQISIAGLSPDAEPSPKQLGDIVQFSKVNNVKYIFFESLASPKLSETIAREIGAQTLVLNPIEGLTPGQLALGGDYFTEMYKNLANLELALGCTK